MISELAAKYKSLLTEALEIAKRKADCRGQLVREILATATVEGIAPNQTFKVASVSYTAEKYRRTWHTLIPWQHLEHTTAEDEAESMIQTVETNVNMTETDSWPRSRSDRNDSEAGN